MNRRKLAELMAAKRVDRELARHEKWTPEQLATHQRQRVDAIVRHAVAHSPFHAERFRGRVTEDRPVDLRALPILDKPTLMEHYDELVTESTLRRDDLLAHAETAAGDVLYRDEYRAITTSGSSGHKGLFVYDRAGWTAVVGGFLRMTRWGGTTPGIPRRKLAYVGASNGTHMSRRLSATLDIGLHRIVNLPATMPIGQIVDALNRFQPDYLPGFPTILAALAEEQLAGRLRIAPRRLITSSELRTPEMLEAIVAAWGVRPTDTFAATETGFIACECEHGALHLFEDLVAVEVVDAEGRPVPDGEVGDQMLVTSLDNRVQPTIRMALSDRVAIDPQPCPCGLPMRRLRAVQGRTDDVIHLPSGNGRRIAVHPMQWAPVARAREVREFQIVQEGPAIDVRVVLHPDADAAALERRLIPELDGSLRSLGVAAPVIRLKTCPALEREASRMGKLKLVVADRG